MVSFLLDWGFCNAQFVHELYEFIFGMQLFQAINFRDITVINFRLNSNRLGGANYFKHDFFSSTHVIVKKYPSSDWLGTKM
jgi:hypothetical protein